MTGLNGKSEKKIPGRSPANLEDWLQLPDTYHEDDDLPVDIDAVMPDSPLSDDPAISVPAEGHDSPADVEIKASQMLDDLDTGPECILHVPAEGPEDLIEKESGSDLEVDADFTAESQDSDVGDHAESDPLVLFKDNNNVPAQTFPDFVAPHDPDIESSDEYEHHYEVPSPLETAGEHGSLVEEEPVDKLKLLEGKLAYEFRDTLTSLNLLLFPIGMIFIIISLIGYFYGSIAAISGQADLYDRYRLWILGGSAVLLLAGIHLLIYWTIHKVSNTVKSGELDRLIELRRFTEPCMYLDCTEVGESESELDGDAGKMEMSWQCTHFDVNLEGSLICAVCDIYQSGGRVDGGIVIEEDGQKE